MQVEIWSDVVCPWCYIGKRRFEAALSRFEHRGEVTVLWRSFELDPEAPVRVEGDLTERLAAKYGMSLEQARGMQQHMTETAAAEGLDFRFDRARTGNTVDAHQLLHLAAKVGVQDAVKERLLAGYFTEGEHIADGEALVRLAAEAGLDAEEARRVLAEGAYVEAVREDERQAVALGIRGVPFFAVDRRYGVSGAQPADALLEVLQTAWEETHSLTLVGAPAATATSSATPATTSAAACDDGSCAV